MHTLGYNFKPWQEAKAIADGPAILRYIKEAASENEIDQHIRYQHLVTQADWSEADACWTVTSSHGDSGESSIIRCRFMLICAGYYNYSGGYTPDFAGREQFHGDIIHPQDWPENYDFRNRKVVVIGSGATAVTLIPELAKEAADVVMLQRSPTYMVSQPDTDWIANLLRKILPEKLAYAITRWKNIRYQHMVYARTRSNPDSVRNKLLAMVRKEMGPDYDVEKHFTPRYDPWDQRLCLVPNSDFFQTVRSGQATIVTDTIKTFTESGLLLESGQQLDADVIVTATGLKLQPLGGAKLSVDGSPVDISKTTSYLGMMYTDLPNLISVFGYINASWTLRADLIADFACRVIRHMDQVDCRQCTPRLPARDKDMPRHDWIGSFSAGYMRRSMHLLPKQGDKAPWLNTQDYLREKKLIREKSLDDGILQFTNQGQTTSESQPTQIRDDAA